MRIGVDLSILSDGAQVTRRGIGRYTFQQLRALFEASADHAYVLFVPYLDRVRQDLGWATGHGFVSLAELPGERITQPDAWRHLCAAHRLDLVHMTAPLFRPLPNGLDTPLVATFYDAIPLAYPHFYLPPAVEATEVYLEAANSLPAAKHLIAISGFAKQQAETLFGYQPGQVTVACPYADPHFQPLVEADARLALGRLRASGRCPERFVLAVPAYHLSKNLGGLLDTVACLSPAQRRQMPLVIACSLDTREAVGLQAMIDRRGLKGDVFLTGAVRETELVALYSTATAFLHLSHMEGFGLPVLEAMQCGTPVIASRHTATAEIVGEAGWLVDPNHPQNIAETLTNVVEHASVAQERRALGLERARQFGPRPLAQATLQAYTAVREAPAGQRSEPEIHKGPTSAEPRSPRWWGISSAPPATAWVSALVAMDDLPVTEEAALLPDPRFFRGLTRDGWGRLVAAVYALLKPGASVVAPMLVHVQGPPDDSLASLPWPVFTQSELETWWADRLTLWPMSPEALPGLSTGLTRWVSWALEPHPVNPTLLRGGRLYAQGHCLDIRLACLTVTSNPPPPTPSFYGQDQALLQRRLEAEDEWIDNEQAYLEAVTETWLTPSFAARWPGLLKKVVRQWRRFAWLGRGQEAQRRILHLLSYQSRRGHQQPIQDFWTAVDLVAVGSPAPPRQ